MMKADMLYQLNLRLQEIKQNKNDFGGISVLLFGDIMQLRPVKARWIFDEPSNPQFALSYSVRSLWELFQVVELKIDHRQGDDHDYADLLNRVRLENTLKMTYKFFSQESEMNFLLMLSISMERIVMFMNTMRINSLNSRV